MILGCFFHFKQAIHKWVMRNNFKKLLNRSSEFRIWVNMLCSLALVPINLVDEGLQLVITRSLKLTDENGQKLNVDLILKYFKSTWMDGRWKKVHWNYFNYIGRRTNNDLEGFNRQLNRFLNSPHPNIYKFVDHIKEIDQKISQQIIEYRRDPLDYSTWSKSKALEDSDTKHQRLKSAYLDGKITLSDYLYAVASHMDLTMYIDDDDLAASDDEDLNEALNDCTIDEVNDCQLQSARGSWNDLENTDDLN